MQLNFEAYRHFFQPLHSSQFTYKLSKQAKCKQSQKEKKCLELEFWIFLRFHPLRKLFTDDALQKVGGSEIFLKRLESNQSVTQKWWSHATNSSPKCCSLSIITSLRGIRNIFINSRFSSFLKKWGCAGDNKTRPFFLHLKTQSLNYVGLRPEY